MDKIAEPIPIKKRSLTSAERAKRYRKRHPEKIRAYKKKYYKEHLEKERENNRRRNKKSRELNPETARERWHRWKQRDLEGARRKITDYHIRRYKEDINFRLAKRLRTRLSDMLRGRIKKVGSHVGELGCTIEELKFYLEGKFKDGMSWDNQGINGWQIDHIIPLSFFNLEDPEQFKKACHYTNLQPLWWRDNLIKGNKIIKKHG